MKAGADSWDGILDPDERIVWQGQPDGRFRLSMSDIIPGAFGGFFAAFAVFWMAMASRAGGFFWMFGLIHFAVGVGLMLARPFGSWWLRRHSFYSLSNRRAFIASDYPVKGRVLKSWPITAASPLELVEGATQTVWFATEIRSGSKGSTRQVRIGFDGIEDGREVFALMRAIQRGMA